MHVSRPDKEALSQITLHARVLYMTMIESLTLKICTVVSRRIFRRQFACWKLECCFAPRVRVSVVVLSDVLVFGFMIQNSWRKNMCDQDYFKQSQMKV